MRAQSTASTPASHQELVPTDDERDELSRSPSPSTIASPPPTTRPTHTMLSRSLRNKPQPSKVSVTTQPAATSKGPKRSRAAPRKATKTAAETPVVTGPRVRRRKRSPTPCPVEDDQPDDDDIEGEGEGEGKSRPLSRHRSRSRSLSIIPTVDMPALTHPAPDDAAVRALGLPQSSRPGAATLSLERDHLIRMREGHFARAQPGRKKDKNRDWKKFTLSEAAWTRLEEVGCVTKGRAWTAHEGYDDDDEPVKPDLPYVILTKLVIASSPRKMLTLNQIYQAMEERWPYFRKLGQTFRNSIRHNLSMNPAFINVERPLSEGGLGTGKGGYWKVSEDTTTSHRGRAKKPRLEAPEESRTSFDPRNPPGLPLPTIPHMEGYPPPLMHMPSSFDSYPSYAGQIAYAPHPQAHCSPVHSAYRPSYYPEHCERSTAPSRRDAACAAHSPASLPDSYSSPSGTSLESPSSHSHFSAPPRHSLPQYSPPSLVHYNSTQSPPDYKITTPLHDMSSLMQLATAAENDQVKRPTLPPLENVNAPIQRLPSVNALLSGPSLSSFNHRTICG